MQILEAIYIALAVFGIGVTIVDLFGALDHGGGQDSGQGGGHHDGGHDGQHDGQHDGGHDGHDGSHQIAAHGAAARAEGGPGSVLGQHRHDGVGLRQSAAIGRFIGVLRLGVYFSLGAGPTGMAALFMKLPAVASLLWASGAGIGIAVFARFIRGFLRRDLDSSFKPEDFLLEEAEITVPVAPGLVGRALVRKFGAQSEVYVKGMRGDRAYARGARVRIIDYQEDLYLVEAADEEHLVR